MRWILIVLAMMVPGLGWAQSALPDRARTPGAINPAVTAATIDTTICVRGWTQTVRPPVSYTEPLKKRQIRTFGYVDRRPWHYEEDHLIPLDLGGSPASPLNLWPEPHLGAGAWGSYAKDRLEVVMVRLVCDHRVGLRRAQAMMARDWIAGYRRYIGPEPDNSRPHRWHEAWRDSGDRHW